MDPLNKPYHSPLKMYLWKTTLKEQIQCYMTVFRQFLPPISCIFIIPLHLLLKEAKQEASQTSLVECFAIQVVTGKRKSHLVLSQETRIRSLLSYGRVLKTDREETILQNLQE